MKLQELYESTNSGPVQWVLGAMRLNNGSKVPSKKEFNSEYHYLILRHLSSYFGEPEYKVTRKYMEDPRFFHVWEISNQTGKWALFLDKDKVTVQLQ